MSTSALRPGAVAWIDISTTDIEAVRPFYESVLGWRIEDGGEESGHYHLAHVGDRLVAGLMPVTPESAAMVPGTRDAWIVSLGVTDLEAAVARARAEGATIHHEPMTLPDGGLFAFVSDPSGVDLGLMQIAEGAEQTFDGETVGSPAWAELWSDDYARAREFYTRVVGWELNDDMVSDSFRYARHMIDGEPAIALADATLEESVEGGRWHVYFKVDDVDAALARAEAAGGRAASAVDDTPFGRLVTVTDPAGAVFRLVQ
ncbi:VOC family protein [Sanguibacter sp. HDW7]|uniref:VOC family protein n=1 Tax=Sanguibacter sp. HDW7 TaxID=2714931 RepID=UPI00140C1F9E|nr:VOC family protein [Sanguibacter sp. HDW7]QIK84647.1 VOC family protein [Sanguibacter sp. HDW7]